MSEIDALVEKVREDVRLVQVALARARIDVHGGGKPIPAEDALARLEARIAEVERLREALEKIAEQQPKTVALIRQNGFVFDSIGGEPGNWQHLAFAIYTDLCEVDAWARNALDIEIGAEIHGPCDESPPLFSQGGVAE